jgi:hypothetical protein
MHREVNKTVIFLKLKEEQSLIISHNNKELIFNLKQLIK